MKRLFVMAGAAAILVGLGFVFPAVAQLRDHGSLPVLGSVLMTLGTVLALTGAGSVVYGFRAGQHLKRAER